MLKSLLIASLLFLAAGNGLCYQAPKGAGKAVRAPVMRPILPRDGGGIPGAARKNMKGAPKGAPLTNPGSPAARLYRATPEERERVLERLPIGQQDRMRRELARFDSLPKDQQTVMIKRSERLAALPPEKQRAFMRQMQALNRLEPERTRAVRQALMRLAALPDDQRSDALNREEFRSRFSEEELQIITDLAAVMMPPM